MCTATWWQQPGRCQLFFNRDERKTRLPAQPPTAFQHSDLTVIAPTDADAGGAWISANTAGLFVALLNHYAAQVEYEPPDPVSRGKLVRELSVLPSLSALQSYLRGLALQPYRPFYLLAGDIATAPQMWQWNGHKLVCSEAKLPLTTSSYDSERITRLRREEFRRRLATEGGLSTGMLRRYHRWQHPLEAAAGVWMEREDARTMSASEVTLTEERIHFAYTLLEAGPDTAPETVSLEVMR